MKTVGIFVILFIGLKGEIADEKTTDTYLEAYRDGQGFNNNNIQELPVNSDRQYTEQQFPYPAPQPQYGPPSGPSGPAFGPPQGPPKYSYGPPAPNMYNYGPPVPAYGPPLPPLQPVYGNPHGMLSFLDKIKWKLDLFTVGKILLKFVIFKKIVSLIAILCLLLFIPTLKHKGESSHDDGGDEGDEERSLKSSPYSDQSVLNNVTASVLKAVEKFTRIQNESVK